MSEEDPLREAQIRGRLHGTEYLGSISTDAPLRSESSYTGVQRVENGDPGLSQDTGDFKLQRKEPDGASSNHLLTGP